MSDRETQPGSIIPGVDWESGVKRLMGNEQLYRKLLAKFAASYGDAAGQRCGLQKIQMVPILDGSHGQTALLPIQNGSIRWYMMQRARSWYVLEMQPRQNMFIRMHLLTQLLRYAIPMEAAVFPQTILWSDEQEDAGKDMEFIQ